ncbi:MAG: sulfite exporter TauE/SafE family protein [Planctomycetota bacterium]
MTLETIFILAGVFILASFIQGLTGFAFGLISVPLFAVLFSAREAVGMVAITGSVLVLYSFFLHRKNVEFRKVVYLGLISILFLPPGAYFLVSLPERTVMLVLGTVIVLLTIYSALFTEKSKQLMAKKGAGFTAAAVSGLLGGAFTSPGPAMVVYLYTLDESRLQAKANVQFFFAVISIAILSTHIVSGTVNSVALSRAAPFLPVVILGTKLGVMLSYRMPVRFFRVLTDIGLIFLGVYIIVTSLF